MTEVIEIKDRELLDVIGGILLFCVGSLWLYAVILKVHPDVLSGSLPRRVGSVLVWGVFLLIGVGILWSSVFAILGSNGVSIGCARREIVVWRRDPIFRKKAKTYPAELFDRIGISAETRRGILAQHSGFLVKLAGPKDTIDVGFLNTHRRASQIATKASECLHLPVSESKSPK